MKYYTMMLFFGYRCIALTIIFLGYSMTLIMFSFGIYVIDKVMVLSF